MKAIPTKYDGVQFRSRLEAKWAVFFDLLGWKWQYEPVDFNGWIPDFAIYGEHITYVEVKPVVFFPKEIADEIDRSGCTDEVLIIGQTPMLSTSHYNWGSKVVAIGAVDYEEGFGWIREKCANWIDDVVDEPDDPWWWDDCVFGRWEKGGGTIGFCHAVGCYWDRISGGYDGGCCGAGPFVMSEIEVLWKEASNQVQWKKP